MSLWRSPEFLKLWAGQTISEIGTRVSREGIPLTAVLTLHASPAQMGWLVAVGGISALIAGPAAGAMADRMRRKPLMIASDLGRALVLACIPLAYFQGWLTMGVLLGAAALSGALAVLFDVAYPTFVPTLVEPDQLLEANSNLALTMSVAEVTGPALTGLLVKLISAPVAILLDAASFVVSALSIAWIARPEPPPARDAHRNREPLLGILRHALRLLRGRNIKDEHCRAWHRHHARRHRQPRRSATGSPRRHSLPGGKGPHRRGVMAGSHELPHPVGF